MNFNWFFFRFAPSNKGSSQTPQRYSFLFYKENNLNTFCFMDAIFLFSDNKLHFFIFPLGNYLYLRSKYNYRQC